MKEKKSITIAARVNSELYKEFAILAKKERRTPSDYLRIIIEDKIIDSKK
jgi:predicted DNA-binding protein